MREGQKSRILFHPHGQGYTKGILINSFTDLLQLASFSVNPLTPVVSKSYLVSPSVGTDTTFYRYYRYRYLARRYWPMLIPILQISGQNSMNSTRWHISRGASEIVLCMSLPFASIGSTNGLRFVKSTNRVEVPNAILTTSSHS